MLFVFFLLALFGLALSSTSANFYFVEHLPYLSCENETSASGLLADFFEYRFESLLLKFDYSIKTFCLSDSDDLGGLNPKTTFKGPIDISTDEIDPDGDFLALMGYSVVLIAKKTFKGSDFFYYFGSFSLSLYGILALLVVLTAFLLWVCERSPDQKIPMHFAEGYRMCLYHSVMMLLHLSDKNIRSIPGRLITFIYLTASSVIGCFFINNVIMRMMTYPHTSQITLQDLNSKEIFFQPGLDAFVHYLASDATMTSLEMDTEKDTETVRSLDENQVVMGDGNYLKAIGGNGCDFYIIDRIPFVSHLLLQIPTTLPEMLRKKLEASVLYETQFSGLDLMKSYTGSDELSNCFEMEAMISSERVISIWVFFFIGIGTSLVVFVASVLNKKFKWFDFLFRSVENSKFKGRKTALKTRNKVKLLDFFDRILQQFKERHINAIKKLSGFAEAEEHRIKLFYTNFKSFFDQIKSRI